MSLSPFLCGADTAMDQATPSDTTMKAPYETCCSSSNPGSPKSCTISRWAAAPPAITTVYCTPRINLAGSLLAGRFTPVFLPSAEDEDHRFWEQEELQVHMAEQSVPGRGKNERTVAEADRCICHQWAADGMGVFCCTGHNTIPRQAWLCAWPPGGVQEGRGTIWKGFWKTEVCYTWWISPL